MKRKVVCLISGGIDSPVAAYLVMNKGFTPVFVYCDNSPYGDEAALVRTVNAISKLKQNHDGETELLVVPHGESLTQAMKCPRKYLCILCKRSMFRIAEAIADLEEADAIVTGEALGQKASQTLINLGVTVEAVKLPIIRPLIGMNKLETEFIGRKIGTFGVASQAGICCSAAPLKPSTRAKLELIRDAEKSIDVKGIVERELRGIRRIKIHLGKGSGVKRR